MAESGSNGQVFAAKDGEKQRLVDAMADEKQKRLGIDALRRGSSLRDESPRTA